MKNYDIRQRTGQWLAGVFCLGLLLALFSGPNLGLADEHSESPKSSPPKKGSDAGEWPKPLMRDVFASMSYLLPRGLDRERFASPSEREGIMTAIEALAVSAAKLENHGLDRGSSLSFLSFSLARDVEEVRMRYATGRYEEARYFLVGSIQNCFSCHSRRPSENRFPIAEQLTDSIELEKLKKPERALLYVVTRRFEEAIETWEEVLRDPAIPPRELDFGGVLLDYLAIAIRGLNRYEPTRHALIELSKRSDVSPVLRAHLEAWVDSLRWLEDDKNGGVSLAHARALVAKAAERNNWKGDRQGLVFDLAASSLLNQMTDRAPGTPDALSGFELSEAYYLLGLIESRSMENFWLDESPNHLEAAVRIEPSSPHARPAFELFEENMITGYGGVSAYDLPTDVWVRLDTLRKLLDAQESAAEPE
ncbi:MAG: hypothetical protein JRG89_06530 [Deltaproteobacteria bacterium]|nr:hypothetical protein [Deltaproteobacteria bacterium]MBW2388077.1 hypothetical protein [Deltaproteobacteria bacterium]MBW2725586.1 hypothetical protein [Deltaproteobacteria bacterium]